MTLSLPCHSCSRVLRAESEEELVELGQQHAVEHGHAPPPPPEHVLARIRRHNPGRSCQG